MQPLTIFQSLFPEPCVPLPDEIRYPMCSEQCAVAAEQKAIRLILEKGLPLTADTEIRSSRGVIRAIAVVIREVPEEYSFADEVQDHEGLSGGWWEEFERSIMPF